MRIHHQYFGTLIREREYSFIIYGGVELRFYNDKLQKQLTAGMINTVNLNLIKRR